MSSFRNEVSHLRWPLSSFGYTTPYIRKMIIGQRTDNIDWLMRQVDQFKYWLGLIVCLWMRDLWSVMFYVFPICVYSDVYLCKRWFIDKMKMIIFGFWLCKEENWELSKFTTWEGDFIELNFHLGRFNIQKRGINQLDPILNDARTEY